MEINNIKDRIMTMECLFTWKLDEIPKRLSAPQILKKIHCHDESSEPCAQISEKFYIAYLHYENKNYIQTLQLLEDCNNFLNISDNCFLITYKRAFKSICYASIAFLAFNFLPDIDLKEVKDNIGILSNLSESEKSGIFAIKASVFMKIGSDGIQKALPFAREALKLNPKEGEWHYLMGDILNRMRHINKVFIPSSEEINYLETAYYSTRSVKAAIFLARVYIEEVRYKKIHARRFLSQTISNEIKDNLDKAVKLIDYALENNKDGCVKTMVRCAEALSYSGIDIPRARKVVEEALKLSPSSGNANKLAGILCLKNTPPMYEEAVKHYRIAATKMVISAEFGVFEIETKLGKNPDPEVFYSRLLNEYKENYHQLITLTHACEFYLFIKKDQLKALRYFLKALEIDPEYYRLKVHYSKVINKEISLYEVLSNEARIAQEYMLYKDAEEEALLRNVLLKVKEHYPKLAEHPIQFNLIQELIDQSSPRKGREESGSRGLRHNSGNRGMRGRGDGNHFTSV